MATLAEKFGATYVADYNRGWATSQRASSLEALDNRNASDAEYDGYLDFAVGRPKWTTPTERNAA